MQSFYEIIIFKLQNHKLKNFISAHKTAYPKFQQISQNFTDFPQSFTEKRFLQGSDKQ